MGHFARVGSIKKSEICKFHKHFLTGRSKVQDIDCIKAISRSVFTVDQKFQNLFKLGIENSTLPRLETESKTGLSWDAPEVSSKTVCWFSYLPVETIWDGQDYIWRLTCRDYPLRHSIWVGLQVETILTFLKLVDTLLIETNVLDCCDLA